MERKIKVSFGDDKVLTISFGEGEKHLLRIPVAEDATYELKASELYERIDYKLGDKFTDLDVDFFGDKTGLDNAKEVWRLVKDILEDANKIMPANDDIATQDVSL